MTARNGWLAAFQRLSVKPEGASKVNLLGKDTSPLPGLRGPRSPKGVRGGMTAEQDAARRLKRQQARRLSDRRAAARTASSLVPSATLMPWGVNLVLPYPPSVNHYWLLKGDGSRYISAQGAAFRAAVKALPVVQTFRELIAIRITACPPDKRRRDLDNLLKSLLDALQHAWIISDDSNVVDLHIVRGAYRQGGSCDVEIRAANGVSKAAQNRQEGTQEVRSAFPMPPIDLGPV